MDHGKEQVATAIAARTVPAWTPRIQFLLLFLLLALVYSEILAKLFREWWRNDDYSHGFFVPLFSAFILWQERARLRALKPAPAWEGLFLVAGALALLVVGVLGAELFLSRTSLIFLLGGLLVYFQGWRFFRALLFPWAVLFLMVPLPAIVFNQIAFPLQLLASQLATGLLEFVGVPVLREGNVIQLPSITLEVVEACSGIRSLVSLGTLAVFYGHFLEPSLVRRIVLVVTALPIAVLANAMRVMVTGALGYYASPDVAQGFFHSLEGWLLFVLSLGMLFGLHAAMTRLSRWWPKARAA